MDNSKTFFRHCRRPAKRPSGSHDSLRPTPDPVDHFWDQPEDLETGKQEKVPSTGPAKDTATKASPEATAALQGSGSQSVPAPKQKGKGRQLEATISGAEVMAEFAWRLEAAAEKKRKREKSAKHVNAAEQQPGRLKVNADSQQASTNEGERSTEGYSKTGSFGNDESRILRKQPRLTNRQNVGLGPVTLGPVMPHRDITERSITSLGIQREEQAPRRYPYTLTQDEMAAVEEARTQDGFRLRAVSERHDSVLQKVQDPTAPHRKDLYALGATEKRVLHNASKRKEEQQMNFYQLTAKKWTTIRRSRGDEGQKKHDGRASPGDLIKGTQSKNLKAKSTNAHSNQTRELPAHIFPVFQEQSTVGHRAESDWEAKAQAEADAGVNAKADTESHAEPEVELYTEAEAEAETDSKAGDEPEWASGSEEGEIREYSHSKWGWTRWRS